MDLKSFNAKVAKQISEESKDADVVNSAAKAIKNHSRFLKDALKTIWCQATYGAGDCYCYYSGIDVWFAEWNYLSSRQLCIALRELGFDATDDKYTVFHKGRTVPSLKIKW